MKYWLFVLLVSVGWRCHGQFGITTQIPHFQRGTLVTNDLDTLMGSFKMKSFSFKISVLGESRPRKIPKLEVKAYSFAYDNTWYYQFRDGFYRLMADGEVRLFRKIETSSYYDATTNYHQQVKTRYWAVKRENEPELTLLRVTGSIGYDKGYFREKASYYFQDAPEIVDAIRVGQYNDEASITSLVKRYNQWLKLQQAIKETEGNDAE